MSVILIPMGGSNPGGNPIAAALIAVNVLALIAAIFGYILKRFNKKSNSSLAWIG